MNICSFWFFFLLVGCISSKRINGAKSYIKYGQNVGTVLFERTDYGRQCWSNEEFIVLSSRRMFQDILPQVKVIDSQNDQYIAHLMDYFHMCLESVRKLSVGKTKHLTLKALTDTLGGYLRVYILPLTRHSYYAGNIKYRNVKTLFELFDELQTFLRTNGAGWSKPSQEAKSVGISPITITSSKTPVACNELIISAPFERDSGDYRSFTFRKNKWSTMKRGHAKRAIENGYNNEAVTNEIIVPLPFLDNEEEPNSIALPFKTGSLQSLYSEKSAFALVKYYIASVKCIASLSSTRTQIEAFNKNLYVWLQQSVRRHLDDEKWYPAFGGVLRVIATLRGSETVGNVMKSKASGTYQMMPKVNAERTSQTVDSASPLYKGKGESDNAAFGNTEIVIIAVVSALVIWLLVGLCLVCYKFLSKHSERCSPCESKITPFQVVHKNANYCEPDTCPSKPLRRGVIEKLQEWWTNKFGRCPGGCQDYADEERYLAAINYASKDIVDKSSRIYPKKRSIPYTKSIPALSLGISRDRASIDHDVCYSSEESTICSDSPARLG